MNTANAISPNLLTFRQLKNLVGKTGGMKLPKAPVLEESNEPVLFVNRKDGNTITVFHNGLFIFQRDDRKTVYAIDRIKSLEYRYVDGSSTVINECDFLDSPCLIPLYIIGDTRLEHNAESVDGYWQEFALENDGNDWSAYDAYANPEDAFIATEEGKNTHNILQKAFSTLTKREQEIINLYYFKNVPGNKIADELGISFQAVYQTIENAKKKMKKFIILWRFHIALKKNLKNLLMRN